jgi:hypothetical protein
MLSASQAAALDDLSQQWGEAYDIAVTRAGWIAKRLDNGRASAGRGERPWFEVVNRDGGNPYCLISDDASEIWHVLSRARAGGA